MSVKKKPLVVVTRKLPDSIETRMRELFDARINLDDTPMTPEQLAEAARSADVLVPTVTDHISADIINQPDCKLRLIANFGNGVDNIDVEAAHARGITVTNTPKVLTEDTGQSQALTPNSKTLPRQAPVPPHAGVPEAPIPGFLSWPGLLLERTNA